MLTVRALKSISADNLPPPHLVLVSGDMASLLQVTSLRDDETGDLVDRGGRQDRERSEQCR